MKLFKVTLRGMLSKSSGPCYGISYVVAEDPTEAYNKIRKFLDDNDIGFDSDRELDTVELIAHNAEYPECKIKLYL